MDFKKELCYHSFQSKEKRRRGIVAAKWSTESRRVMEGGGSEAVNWPWSCGLNRCFGIRVGFAGGPP